MKRRQPYDNNGRFVPLDCRNPDCGCGRLQLADEAHGIWECDGLADPGSSDKELEVCTYSHFDGDPWPMPFGRQ
jgi:hypothetical protein